MSAAGGSRLRPLVTGGGTGGHTYPASTTIRAMQTRTAARGQRVEVLRVGVGRGLKARVAASEGLPLRVITTGRFRRSLNRRELFADLADVIRVPAGVGQAIMVVARFRPEVVFSTRGSVSVPVGIAARMLRHRPLIHEQTPIVGSANRILAMLTDRALLSHRSSVEDLPARARPRAVLTGNPIRPKLPASRRGRARTSLGLSDGVPLAVTGGGPQGSQEINHLMAAILPDPLPQCHMLHQRGPDNITAMRKVAARPPAELADRYRPVAYLHDQLPDLLAAADLVVACSGAGTAAELTAPGLPIVLNPLIPTGRDEQRRTARYLAQQQAAVMLNGPDAIDHCLRDTVLPLLADPGRRPATAVNAHRPGHTEAVDRVVDELLSDPLTVPAADADGNADGRR